MGCNQSKTNDKIKKSVAAKAPLPTTNSSVSRQAKELNKEQIKAEVSNTSSSINQPSVEPQMQESLTVEQPVEAEGSHSFDPQEAVVLNNRREVVEETPSSIVTVEDALVQNEEPIAEQPEEPTTGPTAAAEDVGEDAVVNKSNIIEDSTIENAEPDSKSPVTTETPGKAEEPSIVKEPTAELTAQTEEVGSSKPVVVEESTAEPDIIDEPTSSDEPIATTEEPSKIPEFDGPTSEISAFEEPKAESETEEPTNHDGNPMTEEPVVVKEPTSEVFEVEKPTTESEDQPSEMNKPIIVEPRAEVKPETEQSVQIEDSTSDTERHVIIEEPREIKEPVEAEEPTADSEQSVETTEEPSKIDEPTSDKPVSDSAKTDEPTKIIAEAVTLDEKIDILVEETKKEVLTPKTEKKSQATIETPTKAWTSKWAKFLNPGEKVVLTGLTGKPNPFGIHYERQLILTSTKRLVYLDPKSMVKKGEITWTEEKKLKGTLPTVSEKNNNAIEVLDPTSKDKTYLFYPKGDLTTVDWLVTISEMEPRKED